MRIAAIGAVVLGTGLLAGCAGEAFRTQPLGAVEYPQAVQAARAALAGQFAIDPAASSGGRLQSRPRLVEDAPRERLLGTAPAREIAVIRLRRSEGQVYADVRVEVQRQVTAPFRQMQPITVHNDVPNRPPAQETAALTPAQETVWEPAGRNPARENSLIADLLERLSAAGPAAPATAPQPTDATTGPAGP